jgi:NAD+ synthase (glutamine-hydrolysing)
MIKTMAEYFPQAANILRDIIETPVSPELLPPDVNGELQETEKILGPYEIHDFFLYHMIRRGAGAEKRLYLAEHVFDGVYDRESIKKWHEIFSRRFYIHQFKRSCMPDGPGLGSVCLGKGFIMPSDVDIFL